MGLEQEAGDYTRRNVGGMQPVLTVGDRVRAAFIAGATRPVTDEEVEVASRALSAILGDPVTDAYRLEARTMLEAVRKFEEQGAAGV